MYSDLQLFYLMNPHSCLLKNKERIKSNPCHKIKSTHEINANPCYKIKPTNEIINPCQKKSKGKKRDNGDILALTHAKKNLRGKKGTMEIF